MNIRFLESFVWLARLKSFSAAGEKLSTTQSNISSRVAALERQLRVELHVRGAREFQLTTAGRRLFEYAERIVAMSNQMQRELRAAEAGHGVLRVGIIEMVTMSWLPQLVQSIRASDSVLEVDFVTETSGSLIASLRRDELDVAFVWGPANEPSMANDYICNYGMAWLGAPALRGDVTSMDVVDVARLPIIPLKRDASGHAVVREYFAAYGIDSTPRPDGGVMLSSYSLATAMQLIRSGLGVMAMAPLVMADDLAAGRVAVLPVKQGLPPIYLTACYRSIEVRPYVERIIDMARNAARDFARTVDPAHFWI